MSSISLVIAGLGAVVAAAGGGMLLARCFRAPRADLIAWSIALLGLLISLGAQTLGYAAGFDAAIFRAMAMGGLVIAPLAVVLGLSEIAGKGLAARFCARVYLPALAIVALVVLFLDELPGVAFSKAWPNPHVYYQAPPNYVLYITGAVTVLIAVIAVIVVLVRAGRPAWRDVRAAQLIAGLAACLLAYPGLALLLQDEAKISLPLTHVFTPLLAVAAVLVLLAGRQLGDRDIAGLHGRGGSGQGSGDDRGRAGDDTDFGRGGRSRESDYAPSRSRAADRGEWDDGVGRDGYGPGQAGYVPDQTGDFDRYDDGSMGVYRDGGLYRPEPALEGTRRAGADANDDYEYGWQGSPGGRSDDYDEGFATGDLDVGPLDPDRDDLNHHERGRETELDRATGLGREDELGLAAAAGGYAARGRHPDDWQDDQGQPDLYGNGGLPAAEPESARQDLFGQIAIYTLLEDRVNEFDLLTQRVVEEVRGREPDTLVFIVHAVPSAPMQRILYEVYRDRNAYEWHRQQPYVTSFEADRRPYVLATNVIELGLQQAKVSPFPSVSELFGEPGYDTSGFERPDYQRDYGSAQRGQDDSRSSQHW